jgi:hypothetical protein
MGHERDWIDVLQALLTPVIAITAVLIGVAQWWIARNKLKLDLFDRRWSVYVAVREMLAEMFTHGKTSVEAEQKFLHGIRGARWLFDEPVDRYLRTELWAKVTLLHAANTMLEPTAPPAGRADAAEKKREIMLWVTEQDVAVDAMLDRFLKMDEAIWAWTANNWRLKASRLEHSGPSG